MTTPVTRRWLLSATGLAIPGLALAAMGGADAMSGAGNPARKLGIAVVGLGNFADYALPRIAASARARVAGFVSGDRAKALRYAADYGVPERHVYDYDTFERIADDPDIDLVYLTLPVGLHAEYAIRALDAGKHVLSEKTLAASTTQARAMLAAARRSNRHLLVAYRTYFGPAYRTLHKLVAGGGYGRVVQIDAHKGFRMTLPPGNWRFDPALGGGGCLVDIGVYSVQAARLFAGCMPATVTAQRFSSDDARFAAAEENIVFTLAFPNGVLASGSASWSYALQNRLRLGLEQAWLDLEPASPATGQVLRIGGHSGHDVEVRAPVRLEQLPLMFDHVAEVVLDGAEPAIPATEGLRDLEIIEAIYAAAESVGTVAIADGRGKAPAAQS